MNIESPIKHGNFVNIFHPELRKKVAKNYTGNGFQGIFSVLYPKWPIMEQHEHSLIHHKA
jgi:hypothetical protein